MSMNLRITFFVLLGLAMPLGWKSVALADDDHETQGPGGGRNGGDHRTNNDHWNHHSEDKQDGNNNDGGPSPAGQPVPGTNGTASLPQPAATMARLPILDPEQTKAVVAAGRAVSMPLLLTYLKQYYPGEIVDVKLHAADTNYVYEVRYLANVIFLHTLYLDAQTLKSM
jgi:hypothetical protein